MAERMKSMTRCLPVLLLLGAGPVLGAGDAVRGAAAFQACASCHSVKVGTHLTGPSLANVWQHKAAAVPGFARYSDAIKRSNILWNDDALDKWLTNPDALVPETSMTFAGIADSSMRQDVIAYLKSVAEGKAPAVPQRRGGMMAEPTRPNLKQAPPQGQVTAINHCGDGYAIKTRDGKVSKIWEFNIRFKTDSSEAGPARGKPVIVGAGMQGDRASVVFASPGEISAFIKESCE